MKFKKDVALSLLTIAGALVALFALFVTIPVWFEAVVITLTVVGGAMTVAEIVKARKASYDEATGKHTYKFPARAFVLGTLLLVAVAAIVLLSLKRLFGFALIPVAALLAILFVIALLKKLRVMKVITGLILAILVVALVGYFTSALVHSGVNLNPGISTETGTPETEAPETEAPETEAPETNTPNTNAPETEVPETNKPSTDAPETDKPVVETKNVHLTVYMPKVVNYGEPVRVLVEGIDAHDLKFNFGDVVTVVAVSDSELAVTVNKAFDFDGNIKYTVNDKGHYVIKDSAANIEYTVEVVELNSENTKPENGGSEIKGEDVDSGNTDSKEDYTPAIVKINAPATMSYGNPIRITVQGINANNLKFGNEDFLSIVVISDTEVEVTLIGIVNDAGEVEFVPAAGYITVTDSVTGVNTTIEIVE